MRFRRGCHGLKTNLSTHTRPSHGVSITLIRNSLYISRERTSVNCLLSREGLLALNRGTTVQWIYRGILCVPLIITTVDILNCVYMDS